MHTLSNEVTPSGVGKSAALATVVVAIVALLVFAGCGKQPASQAPASRPPSGEPAKPTNAGRPAGQQAPGKQLSSLTLEFADGTTKTIGDYKGKVVLLDFWATYCSPCLKKLPGLQKMQQRYGDKLVIIAVALDPDVETAAGWAKANGITLPVAKFTDQLKKALFKQKTIAIPQARLIDAQGRLVGQWGPDGTLDEIEAAVKSLLETSGGGD